MALPLGKLTILIGAGVIGSVLAQEGRISKVSGASQKSPTFSLVLSRLLSSIFSKMILHQLARVRHPMMLCWLRLIAYARSCNCWHHPERLQSLLLVEQGWKLSDMLFATRRSLSDARTTIAKHLEQVHSSLSAAKKYLSSRIEHVDKNLDEYKKLTDDTRDEVALLREDLSGVGVDVQSVHHVVQSLETRIGQIKGKQDVTNEGLYRLCEFARNFDQGTNTECIQTLPSSSFSPALELPRIRPTSKTGSLLPTVPALESPSPSASIQTPKFLQPLQTATSASGLKELQGMSNMINTPDPAASNGSHVAKEPYSSRPLSSERSGWKLPGLNASLLMRTRSSTNGFR